MSIVHKGKYLTQEHRQKISISKKGMASNRKGKTWKMINGKRIWLDKNN